jgi:Domain of unknown function (DUF4395)
MFQFPSTINEKASRVVGGVVAVTIVVALLTGALWLSVPLAYGYLARVLTGPRRLSPLGRFAADVAGPRLGPPKPVSGPPKRFAQGVGAAFATTALVAWLLGATTVAGVVLALLMVAAALEAVFAFCVGCKIFGLLMRAGLVSDDVCAECADIWSRLPRPAVNEPPANV